MARPTKETVSYYPHFVRGGRTIFILESKYGNDGYAFWFKLLEILGESEGHWFDCSVPNNWAYLIAKVRCDEKTAYDIMQTLIDLGKIDAKLWAERKVIWCQNFVNNLGSVYKMRRAEIPVMPCFEDSPENKPRKEAKTTKINRDGSELITEKIAEEKKREEERREEKKRIYPYEDIVRLWNDTCLSLPKVQKISDSRRNKIRQRLDEFGKDREAWMATAETLFEAIEASDFLRGDNSHSWKASFDWLFENSNNWVKVLEGNYANKETSKQQPSGSPRLGVGEFIKDGRRTYGTGAATIPMSAPPRPSDRYMWNAEQQNWMLL